MSEAQDRKRLRSRDWFDDPDRIDMSALYLERFMNCGITPEELRSAKYAHQIKCRRHAPTSSPVANILFGKSVLSNADPSWCLDLGSWAV